jgi:hypothetical protein
MPKVARSLPARLATLALFAAPIATLLAPAVCEAEPQGSVGLTIGAAGAGLNREIWDQTVFHLGIHGDVLFGRSKNTDLGVGPYLEILTHAFDEVQFGGGASFLFPVVEYLPIVVSLGAYGRKGDDVFGVEPGITGQVFWGTRSYNFHANYVMQAGIIGQMRYGLGESKETSIVVGAHLDFAAMSLPFLFVINAIRGGSPDTDPVEAE